MTRLRRFLPALLIATCALLPAAFCAAASAESPVPQLAFEPGSHEFGLQEANRSDSQAWLQLRNNGAATAQVNSLDIAGPGAGAFRISGGDCYNGRNLNAAETCSVQVSFAPYDAVPFEAQLRATSEENSTFTADLSGEGGRAIIGPGVNPTNFGSVPVGGAPVIKTIDVSNSGNMSGGLFIAVIAGGAIGSFHLLDENCTGIPLSPGATCNLQVSFQPLSTGAKTARVGLFGDGEGGAQVMLSGVGLDPEASAAGDSPLSSTPSGETRDRRHKGLQRARRRHRRALLQHRRIRLAATRRALG
jgi:hypothetical protein